MTNPPHGWAEATVPDLIGTAGKFCDGDWVETKDQDPNGDVRLIQLADVGDGTYTNRSARFMTTEAASRLRCTFLQGGDVLVARMPDPLGRACIFPGDPKPSVTAVDVCIIRSSVDQRWLMWFLNAPQTRQAIAALESGTTRKRISRGNLATIRLPLPPLAEQHRIVAAIEEHFTRLDAAVAALRRAQANLKRYRASVLKAACEGRLVPTEAELARQEGRDYEPASVLLERLSVGPFGHQYREIALPEGWVPVPLGSLCQVGTGATPLRSKAHYYGGTIPWVTSGALNREFVADAEEFITEDAVKDTNCKVFPAGSLLLAMYGEGKTRGKVSELRLSAATNQAIAALVFAGEGSLVKPFVKVFLAKNYDDVRRLSSGGVQPNLNLSIVKSTVIPLPPLAEQYRIVAEVERLLSVADELDASITHQVARADRLRQAILKRAFEGRLVPQDPNDEPASALLERIRAERAAQPHLSRENSRGRRATDMKREIDMRPLAEVLQQHPTGLTPESLFREAGFSEDLIDRFYAELKGLISTGRVREVRSEGSTLLMQQ